MATRRKKPTGVAPERANLLQHEVKALEEVEARAARKIIYEKENGHYFWGLILARWACMRFTDRKQAREAQSGGRDAVYSYPVWPPRSEAFEAGHAFGLMLVERLSIDVPKSIPSPPACWFR